MKKKVKLIFSIILYLLSLFWIGLYFYIELAPRLSMDEIQRLMILGFSCLSLYFGGFLESRYTNSSKPMKRNLWIFFILYIMLFLTLTLFDSSWGRNGFYLVNWDKELLDKYLSSSFNLVPFKTIIGYTKNIFLISLPTKVVFANLFGNIVCLMPLALFLPLLLKKFSKTSNFLIITLIISIIVELLQFLTLSGSCDIDDIILNVIGALIMYKLLNIESVRNLVNNIFLGEKNKIDRKSLFKIFSIVFIVLTVFLVAVTIRTKLYTDIVINKGYFNTDMLEIVDESESCDTALEYLYEDEDNIYYLPCIKSDKVFLKYPDGKMLTLKDALIKNDISIEDVIEKDYDIIIHSK